MQENSNIKHFDLKFILIIICLLLLSLTIIVYFNKYRYIPPISTMPTVTKMPSSEPTFAPTPTMVSPTISPTSTELTQTPVSSETAVMVINIDPIFQTRNNQRLHEIVREFTAGEIGYLGDNNPRNMVRIYINDVKQVSGGNVNYKVKEFVNLDYFPEQCDQVNYGYCRPSDQRFHFTEENFIKCMQALTPEDKRNHCHDPNVLDYLKLLKDYQVCEKRNAGEISELWIMHRFWLGVWEANMTGPGSFSTNWYPIQESSCNKPLPIMGFSYERSQAEMLHNLSHRVEGTMNYIFGQWTDLYHPSKTLDQLTTWEKFTMRSNDVGWTPACGNAHGFINTTTDYDYSNSTVVKNTCDDWLGYPNLTGETRDINCQSWGCSQYGFMKFWLNHLPRNEGSSNGILNNWWKYIVISD